jgi:hypothetical protein
LFKNLNDTLSCLHGSHISSIYSAKFYSLGSPSSNSNEAFLAYRFHAYPKTPREIEKDVCCAFAAKDDMCELPQIGKDFADLLMLSRARDNTYDRIMNNILILEAAGNF